MEAKDEQDAPKVGTLDIGCPLSGSPVSESNSHC